MHLKQVFVCRVYFKGDYLCYNLAKKKFQYSSVGGYNILTFDAAFLANPCEKLGFLPKPRLCGARFSSRQHV